MSILFKSRHLGVAALIMGTSVLLSRFMGLIRDMVIGHFYGASSETDVYFASFMVPDFINYLLAGGYFSITLIPVLSRCFANNKNDGWKLFSAVFWWVCIFILFFTSVAFVFAPQLTHIVAPGFSPQAKERLAFFLRIILPAQAFFLPGACLTAILYLRRHFVVPALTPLIYNGAIIIFGLLLIKQGMTGFCWGVLIGAFCGSFLLPLWAVYKGSKQPQIAQQADEDGDITGKFKLSLTLKHPELKKIVLLALPLMLGQSMVALDEQFFRIFGSLAQEGSVSLLNYARRLMQVPVGVVAQAAGVASFPFLAHLAATHNTERFNQTLQSALKSVLAVLAPICAFMILGADPIIQLIYQHGGFTPQNTADAALLLRIMLVGVMFWGVQQLMGRAFYAHENTLTPALCGTLVTLVFLPVYYFAALGYGPQGIAGVSVFGVACYAAILVGMWVKKHGAEALWGVAGHGFMACGLSLAALLPAAGLFYLFRTQCEHNIFFSLLSLLLCGTLFSFTYLLISRLLCPAMLEPLAPLGRRLERLGRLGQPFVYLLTTEKKEKS